MTNNFSVTSHIFAVDDCPLVDVIHEVVSNNSNHNTMTTACSEFFKLLFIHEHSSDLHYAKLEYVDANEVLELKQSTYSKVVLFNSSQTEEGLLSWASLDRFMNLLKLSKDDIYSEIRVRFIRPSDKLEGAVQLLIPTALLNDQMVAASIRQLKETTNLTAALIPSKYDVSIHTPGLLVMDMDSTAIQIECIDELAKLAGVGAEVAKVTERAMRGELDFEESLHARVATLKGAPASIIKDVASNLPLMPGLENLIMELKKFGWKIAIVSGGFTAMTEALKTQLLLDVTLANTLDFVEETSVLAGTVSGKVIDAQAKADAVITLADNFDIPLCQTIAMGDGANDLKMMAVANLGVAFHAKPLVNEQADVSIAEGPLDQLLYLIS